jgi:hypothetical protein
MPKTTLTLSEPIAKTLKIYTAKTKEVNDSHYPGPFHSFKKLYIGRASNDS